MVTPITQMFQELASWGILDSLLPFMLIFVIAFAILQKANIFGEKSKKFNIIIALVMAFAVVIPHVMGMQPDVVVMMNNALPQVSVVLVAIVMVLLILGIWAPNIGWKGGVQGWMVLLSLGIVLYIFGNSAGLWQLPAFLYFLSDPGIQSLVIIFLVFAIIIWFVTRESTDEKFKWDEAGNSMGKFFGLNN